MKYRKRYVVLEKRSRIYSNSPKVFSKASLEIDDKVQLVLLPPQSSLLWTLIMTSSLLVTIIMTSSLLVTVIMTSSLLLTLSKLDQS